MEDKVAQALYEQMQASDNEIHSKEQALQRHQYASRELLDILLRSEPLDLKSSTAWANVQPHMIAQSQSATLPTVGRDAWTPCPLKTVDQWVHIINGKVVVGVEVENIQHDMIIADMIGTILVASDSSQEWCFSRSCLLKFDSIDYLWPHETNYLRSGENALLVIAATAPSNLLSCELVVMCQASMREQSIGDQHFLPPLLEPQHWRHWWGELSRTGKNMVDANGIRVPIIPSVVECFTNGHCDSDPKACQKLLASIYMCQEQKRATLDSADAKKVLENSSLQLTNCYPMYNGAKFSRLPLFDGILLFVDHTLGDQTNDIDLLISGWTNEQIDQFLSLLNASSSNAAIKARNMDGSAVDMNLLEEKYSKLLAQIQNLTMTDMDISDNEVMTVDGLECRDLRMDACAMQVSRFF